MVTESETKQVDLGILSQYAQAYYKLQQQKKDLELSIKIMRESIIECFKAMGENPMPTTFNAPDNLRVWVTQQRRESINVEEARQLLPQNLFDKLLKLGEPYMTVTVRKIKEKE